ncbi:MAG: hypothetical protein R3B82_10135 [Sandaracinaceae bacterium]
MRWLLALALLLPATAGAQSTDGVYRRGRLSMRAEPGALPVTHGRYASRFVHVGAPIQPRNVTLSATSNANDEFTLFMRYGPGDCANAVLRLGDDVVVGTSYCNGPDECCASVTLDASLATRAAVLFGVPRQDRRAVATDVRGTFEAPARVRAGQPVEIRLKLFNPEDAPPVMRLVGGRNRGPRNNRFSFTIRRDGVEVPPIDGWDFGGLTGYQRLAPGEEATVVEQLERWGDVSVPGTYEVECRFETTFAPDGSNPFDDDQRGRAWDRVFTGTVRFVVAR